MSDDNKYLPAGTELVEANGTRYKICRQIAVGGSAIVYEAEQIGKFRVFVLKECFPGSKNFAFVRRGGSACPADPEDSAAAAYLRNVKQNMEHENETGQLLANLTGRTIAPWGKLNVSTIILDGKSFDAKDSLFIVMERITDDQKRRGIFLADLLKECAAPPSVEAPLRNGGNPSAYVASCILEQLLKALRDIHAAGYIHGDINDANFFLMGHDYKSGDIGVGQLLDFGNARKLLEDGKTAPVEELFSTPGYWSPEILLRSTEPLRLTPATDIYSAGCLMLYLFYGMKYKEARGKTLASSKRNPAVSIPEAVRHGYRREAAVLFRKILFKALQFQPEARYQTGEEMLEDISHLKKLTAPPKFLLAQNLSRSPYFVDGSRDKELAELQRDMDNGKHPLYIFGLGGIGKTELANEFARLQIKNGTPAYFTAFKGTMRETILSLRFSGYEFDTPGTEADYRRRLDILKENYRSCLLIVDNFDDDEKPIAVLQKEAAYKEVVYGSGMKILFTTRSRPDEVTKELTPLEEEDAMRLFTSISPVAEQDKQIVRELIREADCHPMTVELLAKTRENSWQSISYEELLRRLRYRNAADENFPGVSIKKNLIEREAKIYEHLRTLFNICRLGEEYRQVLCHVTLLPLDGFNAVVFISNEDDDKKIQLKNLESHSWIRRHKENNLLYIHPMIRAVFKKELCFNDSDCAEFLKRIWNIVDNSYPGDLELFRQAGELFERATNDLPDLRGDFAFYAGFCFIAVGKFSAAVRYEDKAIKIRKVVLADKPRELARNYNDAGIAALSSENFGIYADSGLAANEGISALSGDFDKGMGYLNESLKILETLPEVEDKQNLANVCSNMAMVLCNREDFDKAWLFAQRAVELLAEYPNQNLYERAHAYQALGQILMLKKHYAESLIPKKTAAALLEKVFTKEHPLLASAYRELAEAYDFNEDFVAAEAYIVKAIDMLEKIFPDNHPDLLAVYRTAAAVFADSGQAEKSKFYAEKSRDIFLSVQANIWTNKLSYAERMIEAASEPVDQNILRHNPTCAAELMASQERDLIKYNRDAAEACLHLKDYEAANKFLFASMKKISASTELKEVSRTSFLAAQILYDEGKFSDALLPALKGLNAMISIKPSPFEELSEQFIQLGNIYSKLEEHEEALKNFKRAAELHGLNPNPENARAELAMRAGGEELMHLKRFDEAAELFTEILARQRTFLHENHPRIIAVKKLLDQACQASLRSVQKN